MKAEQIYKTIRQEKIIVIVRGIEKDRIVNAAQAVLAAGVKMLEVTCNTAGVFEMLKLLNEKMADKMVIGAGTVITKDLCEKALNAGAKYIIAPDVNPEVIAHCVKHDIAVLPGAATATEILTAKRCGAKMVKIFPAAALGLDYIKQLRGPIDDIDFVAVGGVRPETISDFSAAGCIAIGIGESAVKKEFVEKGDWQAITETVKKYVKILR
ncbi:MAG: bifunctional 4-hydroxy-2-oxoglutarate aldolase/2-dehydro-3-deoxy-phosphogluconate aldolase [Sedimentisphaerales bacterium]|nr:bifunctional 4-hydroxy-2-oxoglutarate aldolase/2-dehydro-3-deoxy-phosphogluconate aldolase [Sedimentisphaerales bacterium]